MGSISILAVCAQTLLPQRPLHILFVCLVTYTFVSEEYRVEKESYTSRLTQKRSPSSLGLRRMNRACSRKFCCTNGGSVNALSFASRPIALGFLFSSLAHPCTQECISFLCQLSLLFFLRLSPCFGTPEPGIDAL